MLLCTYIWPIWIYQVPIVQRSLWCYRVNESPSTGQVLLKPIEVFSGYWFTNGSYSPPFVLMGHGGYSTVQPLSNLWVWWIRICCFFFFPEYYFTDRASMQKSVDAGEFIEWAIYNGNMYGTRWAVHLARIKN